MTFILKQRNTSVTNKKHKYRNCKTFNNDYI